MGRGQKNPQRSREPKKIIKGHDQKHEIMHKYNIGWNARWHFTASNGPKGPKMESLDLLLQLDQRKRVHWPVTGEVRPPPPLGMWEGKGGYALTWLWIQCFIINIYKFCDQNLKVYVYSQYWKLTFPCSILLSQDLRLHHGNWQWQLAGWPIFRRPS